MSEPGEGELCSRVLYVAHTSLVSGAEHSLLTLLASMDSDRIAGLACPPGRLADDAARLGVRIYRIRGISGSMRLHPRHTSIAAAELLQMGLEIARIAQKSKADVIHANDIRAGLGGIAARCLCGRALVVHIRDCLPDGRVSEIVKRVIASRADALIAISRHVSRRFVGEAPSAAIRAKLHVVDDPVDMARFRPPEMRRLSHNANPVVAIIGQITSWKGHDTLVRALPNVRACFPGTRLAVVGEVKFAHSATRFDNPAFLRSLHFLISELGLDEAVDFLGERDDIGELMAGVDAILVPSVEEPFGRTVAEAMAVGTPVIATAVGGPAELIEDGVSGALVPPGKPEAWSEAILGVLARPGEARRLAARARMDAERRFDPASHARVLEQIYGAIQAREDSRDS